MSDDNEKTSVVASDTFKIRMSEAQDAPPSIQLLLGPASQVGRQWNIEKSKITIGRAIDAHIFVDDKSVSKTHAELTIEGNDVFIMDLGSTNGTVIQSDKLEPSIRVQLRNNDQIKTGNVIFKFMAKGNVETVSAQKTFDRTQIDALTQIYNKGALESIAKEMFKKAQLIEMPLGVIVFDLDNFKMINDTYGHQAGDFVLRELAHVVNSKLIRQGDLFGRFGGEEFCLVVNGSPLDKTVEVAERIRKTIENHEFKYKDDVFPITISVGISCLDRSINTWEELFEKADQATYMSKKNGKNRVSSS